MRDWKEIYKLPLHNQELKEGHVLPYVFCENGTMALTFERKTDQDVRQMIVMMINGINSNCLDNVTSNGSEIYVENELLMTVRGWGNLTGQGALNLPEDEAIKIQDSFINFILGRLKKNKASDNGE